MLHAYARVSTREQARTGVSLAGQEHRLVAFANARGFQRYTLYTDGGISGGMPLVDRPEGGRMVGQLCAGDTVVAVSLDRLFRDPLDCLQVSRQWETADIKLALLDLQIDTSTAMGKAALAIVAALAGLERDTTKERSSAGLLRVRALGGVVGRPPYGWRAGRSSKNLPILIEDPAEQAVIHYIVSERDKGMSYFSIASALNTKAIKKRDGGRWYPQSVYRVVVKNKQCG